MRADQDALGAICVQTDVFLAQCAPRERSPRALGAFLGGMLPARIGGVSWRRAACAQRDHLLEARAAPYASSTARRTSRQRSVSRSADHAAFAGLVDGSVTAGSPVTGSSQR